MFLLIILSVAASYYRFSIIHDYLIYDEFECDPSIDSCFVYCEDESIDCEDAWYYVEVQRYAADLMTYCDGDITDCDAAYECQLGEDKCEITYCDSEISDNCVSPENYNQDST